MNRQERILHFQCRTIEFLFLFGLLLLSLIPIWHNLGVAPDFLSVVIYLWIIYRPDLVSLKLFILLGICQDAIMGYPIGVGVLEIILLLSIAQPFRRYVLKKNFWIVFLGYAVFTTFNSYLFWLILSATRGYLLPLTGSIKPIIFNILSYPVLCQLSLNIQQKINKLKLTSENIA